MGSLNRYTARNNREGHSKGKHDPPRKKTRRSESPNRERSPKKESNHKRRIEAVDGKESDDNEEENRKLGKRPLIAAIIGGD
ncbi:hypothetical protein A2U01_0076812 [Trifolium medium]|uniref:Uncharacterized protein n=1 Tax=Trifolium medium TaxID=97028 RepID=A0A392T371_9FABA|nr:hypothetical protein [Trifolium medium]